MDEALISFGVLGAHRRGQHRVEIAEEVGRVDHATLRIARMDGVSAECSGDLAGVEALPFQLTDRATVDGVGIRASERFDIEQRRPMPDLFIRAEADAERRVRQLGVGAQAGDERHDLGDTRFVVGTEQGRAVGANQVLAHEAVEGGQLIGADGDRRAVNFAAHELAAFVVHDMRLHPEARDDLGGVEVGDEPERRLVLGTRACGDLRRHIGMIGHRDVLGTKAAQLVGEHAGEVELDLARGRLVGMRIARGRVDLHIAQETLKDIGLFALFSHDDSFAWMMRLRFTAFTLARLVARWRFCWDAWERVRVESAAYHGVWRLGRWKQPRSRASCILRCRTRTTLSVSFGSKRRSKLWKACAPSTSLRV